nr:MAG TPA: hypothetical protein [Caudoviricetes sp.]
MTTFDSHIISFRLTEVNVFFHFFENYCSLFCYMLLLR